MTPHAAGCPQLNLTDTGMSNKQKGRIAVVGRSEEEMNKTVIIGMALACMCMVAGCATDQQAVKANGRTGPSPMTIHDITAMSHAGVSDSLIVSMISLSGSQFHLNANDIIALADSGVSHPVIDAMIKSGENAKQVEEANPVFVYPWYPYYWYDPFWYPWYYPGYSLSFGFNYGFHHGFRPHYGGMRHFR
jgi:hypothetical protein